ncbi:T9SS type A sorting domain-containing protein [Tenacibaculum amylolyticum]|uniref:T9SS type A sorting domain-containing protein n=1 Tax=Tenacibaculum amylolyticum TaxID=104269 RepID=UPI0038B51BE8
MKKIILLLICVLTYTSYAQNISFTFVNARNTNDGTNDFYEADIYISSDVDFKLGSGQIYFNYNTEAFGNNVHTNGSFEYLQPAGSILAEAYGFPAYKDFIVNDNTTSRVSTSFQQGVSSGTITANNITTTAKHLCSIKIKYTDVSKDPMVTFEDNGVFLDQFFTACGPASVGFPDCTNNPGVQLTEDTFNSSGAALPISVSWTGNSSRFWGITSNWSDTAIPNNTKNAIIPDVANDPIINSGNYEINDVTIASGASLTMTGATSLSINGDLNNNGTISLSGNTNNSSAFIVSGTASGAVTFQQDGLVANEWTIVSAPVIGQSIKEFVENAANNIRINTTVTPNRYAVAYYDDSNADGSKWVYYTTDDLTTNAITFEKGKGYAISRATDGSISFTGSLETSEVTQTVNASQWNAIGNPYTAYLPINENSGSNFINDNLSKFDPAFIAVYVWDTTQNKYVANSLVDSESQLAPGQGFFVRTTSGVSEISFNQAQRTSQMASGSSMRPEKANANTVIQLFATANKTTVSTTINYLDTATKGLDVGYDIGNFEGASFDIYTHLVENTNTNNFTIQSLPKNEYETIIIPLGLVAEADTAISFSIHTVNIPADVNVYLEDKHNGTFTNLSEKSHNLTLQETVKGTGRFFIHTSTKTLDTEDTIENNTAISMYTSEDNQLIINGLTNVATIKVFSMLGEELLNKEINANTQSNISLNELATGVYIVKLQSVNTEITKKIIVE